MAQALFPGGTDDPGRAAIEAMVIEGYGPLGLGAAQVRRMRRMTYALTRA